MHIYSFIWRLQQVVLLIFLPSTLQPSTEHLCYLRERNSFPIKVILALEASDFGLNIYERICLKHLGRLSFLLQCNWISNIWNSTNCSTVQTSLEEESHGTETVLLTQRTPFKRWDSLKLKMWARQPPKKLWRCIWYYI